MNEELILFAQQVPVQQQLVFLKKLADQLAKDLYPLFIESAPEEPTADWLVSQTCNTMQELIGTRSSELGSYL